MKRQEAYFILIVTFILVVLWIVFSILHSATDSTISSVINTQIARIDPTFNTKIIDGLKSRQQITPLAGQIVITPAASASAKITPPAVTPTPAAQVLKPINELNTTNATNTAVVIP